MTDFTKPDHDDFVENGWGEANEWSRLKHLRARYIEYMRVFHVESEEMEQRLAEINAKLAEHEDEIPL